MLQATPQHLLEWKWTEDRVCILVVRWQAGCSALEIANEIGTTRNSVIGKIDRMQIERKIDNAHWTEEQVTVLRRLWLRGDSAADIATAIHRRGEAGPNITRQSIISKAYSIGLKARKRTRTKPESRSRLVGIDPTIDEGPAPEGFLSLTFAEIQDDQCRYPRGGGEKPIVFCGKPKMKTSVYCIDCYERCYTR